MGTWYCCEVKRSQAKNHAFVTSSSSISTDFAAFRSACPLKKFAQPHSHLEWPDHLMESLWCFCMAPAVMSLSEKGYRAVHSEQTAMQGNPSASSKLCEVISAQYPAFSNPADWCKAGLLEALCRAVHIIGAGLGGFLAQRFAARYATRAMQDTLPQGGFMELSAKQAIDWVGLQMNDLSGDDLASRLSLNCSGGQVEPLPLEHSKITILESNGETMVPDELRRQLKLMYQGSCFAELKSRGDFPYLSRPEEVTLFIEVHMRRCGGVAGAATATAGYCGAPEPGWWLPGRLVTRMRLGPKLEPRCLGWGAQLISMGLTRRQPCVEAGTPAGQALLEAF
eukprot:Skav230087  [mRNA]  locus=scaffold2569:395550:408164:- [translate_table: standard]